MVGDPAPYNTARRLAERAQRLNGEVTWRAADSDDDFIQEIRGDTAAWPFFEEVLVDGRELLTKQNPFVAEAAACSGNDQARGPQIPRGEDGYDDHVITGTIANVS
jgi:hypothetical protein